MMNFMDGRDNCHDLHSKHYGLGQLRSPADGRPLGHAHQRRPAPLPRLEDRPRQRNKNKIGTAIVNGCNPNKPGPGGGV
jgi:hypothetical protein